MLLPLTVVSKYAVILINDTPIILDRGPTPDPPPQS